MATPIKKKKMKDPLEEGYKTLDELNKRLPPTTNGTIPASSESASNRNDSKATPMKKAGRPPAINTRKARFNLCLTDDTLERLSLAYVKERRKLRDNGAKIDKSWLIENIIIKWLDENKY